MIWFKFCLEYATACLSCMMCLNFEGEGSGVEQQRDGSSIHTHRLMDFVCSIQLQAPLSVSR
jgi:hypothetical protein